MFTLRQRHGQLAILMLLGFASQQARAAPVDLTELSLEQLLAVEVSSASKYSQRTTDAPSAVQVISGEDIRLHGWRTLSEALASLPGIYINNDRVYDFLGARGFQIPGDYNTRFLLLVDGQRNNDNIYQQALTGSEGWLDMSVVERIEYIPGPGSAIYGSNAANAAPHRSRTGLPECPLLAHILIVPPPMGISNVHRSTTSIIACQVLA